MRTVIAISAAAAAFAMAIAPVGEVIAQGMQDGMGPGMMQGGMGQGTGCGMMQDGTGRGNAGSGMCMMQGAGARE